MRSLRAFPFLIFLSFSLRTEASVWKHDNNKIWSATWEQKYSDWVHSEVDTSWLQKKDNPFYSWPVDCAKFAYLLKIYFASIHQLEFAINDPSQKGRVISSRSARWDTLTSEKSKLQSFARYILARVNTRTLPNDSILLDITPNSLVPGVILASDRQRGHTMVLKHLKPSGAPTFIFATLPASEFLYESYAFPAAESFFPSKQKPSLAEGGFRRLKWPQELNQKTVSLLDQAQGAFSISRSQEDFEYHHFFEEVQKKVQKEPLTNIDKFDYALEDLCMKMRIRVNVIIDAGHALEKLKGRSFTSDQIDLYSTYARDKDIQLAIEKVDLLFNLYQSSLSSDLIKKYSSLLRPEWNSNDYCWVQWADNRIEPLGALRDKFIKSLISSDPYASFAKRWGE
ncbi:MAG: hypothetical protein KDD45_08710 [Bdellovibrionales bacterium]|nr:hypothetical protein [Bdellovibrionales bacterium]